MEYFAKKPTVFVVIVNWNYARFVADAIKSVKDQTYQNFQCIVIDNGSDDESVDRIVAAVDNHRQFTILRLPSNLGHLGAALWSLEYVTGEFVTFLDADDVLSPTYLASHLQAHLAAAFSVGFTSSNCVDVNAEGVLLTSGNCWMYHYWQQGAPALRPIERTVRVREFGDEAYSALAAAARYVSAEKLGWSWCPGSSNMFRRALLDNIRPSDASPAIFAGVDGFFTPILHALTGTILIDQPLSAYRVHGTNDYSTLPSLTGIGTATQKGEAQSIAIYLSTLIWLIDRIDDVLTIAPASRFWGNFRDSRECALLYARALAARTQGRISSAVSAARRTFWRVPPISRATSTHAISGLSASHARRAPVDISDYRVWPCLGLGVSAHRPAIV